MAKSTVWYILRKRESTGEVSNTKRPGHPWKTTVADDRRIISMLKKNPFTTANLVNNTVQQEGVSIGKSTIKRRLHESKYRGFTARLDRTLPKNISKKSQHSAGKTDETKINLSQNDGKKKCMEKDHIVCKTQRRQYDGLGVHGYKWHWDTSVC